MTKMMFLLISVAVAGVLAEPPVSNSYLPPSLTGARTPDSQYGAPQTAARFGGAPSTQYGVPSDRSFGGILSSQYGASALSTRIGSATGALSRFGASGSSRSFSGAFSSRYGAPLASSRFGGASTGFGEGLSTQYGVPSTSGRSFNGALSTQYGVPSASGRSFDGAPSTQYGVPAASGRSFNGAPSSQYGIPSTSGRSFNGAPSTQYGVTSASGRSFNGAPSTQYGVPAASWRSFSGAPSTQYGVPEASGRSFNGAPSTQYGVPAASSRFSALPTQYGAPAGNSLYSGDGGYAAARNLAREDDLAEPANYEFGYEVEDAESGATFSQQEARQDEQAQGSYRVLLPDGRLQIVEYEADLEGYKPTIRYEDTGYARDGPQQGPY